jgi:hypothetical protein
MQNIEIKLHITDKPDHLTINQVIDGLMKLTQEPMQYRTLKISSKIDLEKLTALVSDNFDCTVREGISDGCYGMRPGTSSKGLTVFMHPKELTDRYIRTEDDGEKTEFVNPWHLFEENANLTDLDGEAFESWAEALGIEYKADNTYNYSTDFGSIKSENAAFMFDFQFSIIETKDGGALVSVMFHCGGDPRGNYTSKVVYKFKCIDDLHSAIYPGLCLLNEEEL